MKNFYPFGYGKPANNRNSRKQGDTLEAMRLTN